MSPADTAYRTMLAAMRPVPARWRRPLLVATGGVVGTSLRLLVGEWIVSTPDRFPWETFLVNVAGAAALGYLLPRLLHGARSIRFILPLVGIGVLGSFTTFSGFTVEIVELLDASQASVAMAYAVASVGVGLVAAFGGRWVGERRW